MLLLGRGVGVGVDQTFSLPETLGSGHVELIERHDGVVGVLDAEHLLTVHQCFRIIVFLEVVRIGIGPEPMTFVVHELVRLFFRHRGHAGASEIVTPILVMKRIYLKY